MNKKHGHKDSGEVLLKMMFEETKLPQPSSVKTGKREITSLLNSAAKSLIPKRRLRVKKFSPPSTATYADVL